MKFRLHLVALSLALGILPGLAQALGLGELTVRSHLYEPLDADIELVSVGDLGESEILANLAGSEEFSRAGIQRFYHLVQIRFQIARNDGGRMVIRLSTEKPVTEPFLNFLAEVHWPKGRLMREYTILLDPVTYARIMPELVEEPVAKAPQPATESTSAASTPDPKQPAPMVSREVAPARTATSSSEQKKKDLKSASSEPEPAPKPGEPKEYGPVKSGDTLWAIAKQQRPAGVSINSAMLAIQRVNPDAFINDNINLLKRGVVLRIPTLEEIEGIGEGEAKQEVARQEEVWRVRREPEAAAETEDDAGAQAKAPADDGALRLVTASADAGSSANVAAEADSEQLDQLQDQLASSKEQLDEARREGDELRGKVGQLEEQIETLSRLIELKNEQLANLQQGAEQASDLMDEGAADMADDGMLPESDLPGELSADEGADAPGDDLDAQLAASDDMAYGDTDAAPTDDLLGDDAGDELLGEDTAADTGAAQEIATAEPAPEPVAVTPQAIEEPQPEPSLVDKVLGNPMLLGAVGGGVLLLLLGGMFAARRRGGAAEADEADLADDGDALGLGDEELSLQDDDLGDLDLVDSSEEEAVAEAAEQDSGAAEELSLEAVPEPQAESEPEEDVPSLDDLGMELAADIAGGDQAGTQQRAEETADLEAELDAALGELELDDSELDDAAAQTPADDGLGELELDDTGLGELELDDSGLEETAAQTPADDGLGELELDDTDLGELELDDSDLDEAAAQTPADDGLGELELDDTGLDEAAAQTPADDGLGELELDDTGLDEVAAQTPADDGLGELELDDTGLDGMELDDTGLEDVSLDETASEQSAAPAAPELDADDGLDDDLQFESADEVATKLDLARAYIEMGDAEGAREILDEVLVEGDDSQKSDAQQLIDQL